jgi:histidine triad (HIT) family protein
VNDCPFCDFEGEVLHEYQVVIAEGDRDGLGNVIVFEPLNPVTPGHVLLVPRAHVADFAVNPILSAHVMACAATYVLEADVGDCNLITSRGEDATQTVRHLHVHVVPRKAGDELALPWTPG